MTQWSIEPSGLESLLNSARSDQASMNGALEDRDFTAIFSGLGSGPDVLGEVLKATNTLLQDQRANLTSICNTATSGIDGVALAARACAAGNEDMAASIQSQMVTSAVTGDFTFFEQVAAQEGW